MTEAEWLGATQPAPLLTWLEGKASARKLRLFAVACFRRLARLPMSPTAWAAADVAERFADGRAGRRELGEANGTSFFACGSAAHTAAVAAAHDASRLVSFWSSHPDGKGAWGGWVEHDEAEQAAQCELLRCVFGNPFRRVKVDPAWFAWGDGAARRLAEVIYDEKAFDRMGVLGDALEDAGCTHEGMLEHCRAPVHIRGCWVVDRVLGKA